MIDLAIDEMALAFRWWPKFGNGSVLNLQYMYDTCLVDIEYNIEERPHFYGSEGPSRPSFIVFMNKADYDLIRLLYGP